MRSVGFGILLLTVLAVVGCSDSPAYGTINETTWQVVAVWDERLDSVDATVDLDRPSLGLATISTPCRVVQVSFVFDSDGEAVSFGDPGAPNRDCASTDSSVDAGIAGALAAAASWHLLDDSTIEVRNADGRSTLQMTQVPGDAR